MNHINVRAAEPADAECIYGFICALENFEADKFNLFRHYYEGNLRDENKIHLIAVARNGDTVGYLSCYGHLLLHHLGMVYEIQEMFVTSEYRSHGIGKLLLAELQTILEARPHASFEVTTNKLRTDALRFYEKNGFVQTHFKLVRKKPSPKE